MPYKEKFRLFHDKFIEYTIDEIVRYRKISDGIAIPEKSNAYQIALRGIETIPVIGKLFNVINILEHYRLYATERSFAQSMSLIFPDSNMKQTKSLLSASIIIIAKNIAPSIKEADMQNVSKLAALATFKLVDYLKNNTPLNEEISYTIIVSAISNGNDLFSNSEESSEFDFIEESWINSDIFRVDRIEEETVRNTENIREAQVQAETAQGIAERAETKAETAHDVAQLAIETAEEARNQPRTVNNNFSGQNTVLMNPIGTVFRHETQNIIHLGNTRTAETEQAEDYNRHLELTEEQAIVTTGDSNGNGLLVRYLNRDQIRKLEETEHEEVIVVERPFNNVLMHTKPIEDFTGRENNINQIHDYLNRAALETNYDTIAIVSGLPGMGKTQLVLKFIEAYKDEYNDRIRIIKAGNEDLFEQSLIEFAEALKIKINPKTNNDFTYVITPIKERLKSEGKCLLVIEDVEDFALIRPLLENLTSDKKHHLVIVTKNENDFENAYSNRNQGFSKRYFSLKLGALEEAEYIRYIRERLERKVEVTESYGKIAKSIADDDIRQLAQLFGGIPLGISQSISYIISREISIEDYLQDHDMAKSNPESLNRLHIINHDLHSYNIYVALSMTLKSLASVPHATELIKFCSLLNKDNIPVSLFESYFLNRISDLNPAKAILRGYSLITLKNTNGEELISLHQLIQEAARLNMVNISQELHKTFNLVSKHMDGDGNEEDDMDFLQQSQRVQPHIFSLIKHYEALENPETRTIFNKARLHVDYGNLQFSCGNMYRALENYNIAKNLISPYLSNEIPEDFLYTNSRDNLIRIRINIEQATGSVYERISKYNEALDNYKNTLVLKESYYSGESQFPIKLARTEYSIGCTSFRLNKYQEATKILTQALKRIVSEDTAHQIIFSNELNQEVINSLGLEVKSLLANILDVLGSIYIAKANVELYHYLPQTPGLEKSYNPSKEDILNFLIFLGFKLKNSFLVPRELKQALEFYKMSARVNFENYKHNNHPKILIAKQHEAEALLLQNNIDLALMKFEENLAFYKMHYEDEKHIDIAIVKQSIAKAKSAKGEHKAAEILFLESLRIIEEYGDQYKEHKSMVHHNLGIMYYNLMQYSDSLSHLKQAFAIKNDIIPDPSMPTIKQIQFHLGSVELSNLLIIPFIVKTILESLPQFKYLCSEVIGCSKINHLFPSLTYKNLKLSTHFKSLFENPSDALFPGFLQNIKDSHIDNLALILLHASVSAVGVYCMEGTYLKHVYLTKKEVILSTSLPYAFKLFYNDLYFASKHSQLEQNTSNEPIKNVQDFYNQCSSGVLKELYFGMINLGLSLWTAPKVSHLIIGELAMRVIIEGMECYNSAKTVKTENEDSIYYEYAPYALDSLAMFASVYFVGINAPVFELSLKALATNMILVNQITFILNVVTFADYTSKHVLSTLEDINPTETFNKLTNYCYEQVIYLLGKNDPENLNTIENDIQTLL